MKSSSTAGIPICLTTGEQLATVKLAVFDPQQHQTLGFLVEWGGWAGSAKVLPWSKRVSVSEKSIEIASASQIVPASQAPHMQSVLVGSSLSRSTLIATADGRIAGTLHDVHFDPPTGAIRGYELVFAKGETAGQHVLLTPDQVQYDPAESVLVVPAVTDAQIQASANYRD